MKLVFCKSNLPLSLLIRWGLNEPVSHFALVFADRFVFHADLLGTRIAWFKTFEKAHQIVYTLEKDLTSEQDTGVWDCIVDEVDNRPYDYTGFLYFCLRALLKRFLKIPMPQNNAWANRRGFLCSGLAKKLPLEYFPQLKDVQDFEMISPYELWLLLNKKA